MVSVDTGAFFRRCHEYLSKMLVLFLVRTRNTRAGKLTGAQEASTRPGDGDIEREEKAV